MFPCKLMAKSTLINTITIYNFTLVPWLSVENMSQCKMFSKESHSALCIIDTIYETEVFNNWKSGPRMLVRKEWLYPGTHYVSHADLNSIHIVWLVSISQMLELKSYTTTPYFLHSFLFLGVGWGTFWNLCYLWFLSF